MKKKKEAAEVRSLPRPEATEIPLPEVLIWKVRARQAELERAKALVEVAQHNLQAAVRDVQDQVEAPEGYELGDIDLQRGVCLCRLRGSSA